METALKMFFWVLVILALVVLGLFITQFVWSWVVNDVFIGAVSQGLLPATITLWQAFKLDILLYVLVGSSRSSK